MHVCLHTHTHTHTVAVLAELMATQSREQPKTWLYISVYINWLSIGQAKQEVRSLARGFPG